MNRNPLRAGLLLAAGIMTAGAAAMGWLLVAAVALPLALQARALRGRSYAVLSGRSRQAVRRQLNRAGQPVRGPLHRPVRRDQRPDPGDGGRRHGGAGAGRRGAGTAAARTSPARAAAGRRRAAHGPADRRAAMRAATGEHHLAGTIADVAFRGRGYEHAVDVPGHGRLTGVFSAARTGRGETVGLRLEPAGCHLFAPPAHAPDGAGASLTGPGGEGLTQAPPDVHALSG